MNLFGLSIGLTRNGKLNGQYVKRDDCRAEMERLRETRTQIVQALKDHMDGRFDMLNNRITDLFSKR